MRRIRREQVTLIAASAPGLILMSLLFILPVSIILIEAVRSEDGGLTFHYISEVLSDPYSWRIAGFTFFQALLSTLFALLLGFPGAYLLSHYNFKGKRLVQSIAQIPFVLPSILVVLGFVIFFGNSGVLNSLLKSLFDLKETPLKILYSFKAIILAHTFYNFPISLSIIAAFWQQLDTREESAAMTLGATHITAFRTITLPRLIPAISAAASMIFLFCFTSFSIILVLGGGPKFTTLEVQIYQLARVQFDVSQSAAFAIYSLAISSGVLILYIRSQHWMQKTMGSVGRALTPKRTSTITKIMILLYMALILLLIVAPLLSIVFRSIQEPIRRTGVNKISLRWYLELFGISSTSQFFKGATKAILSSIGIASIVTLLSVPISLSLSTLILQLKRRMSIAAETLFMLPMAVSSVIIGLGYAIIASKFPVSQIAYPMIIGAHLVIATPFMIRSVLPVFRKIHAIYTPAALVLGATPLKAFLHIQLPLLKMSIISGAIFVFAISIGEMNATLLLSDAKVTTIPILLYRLIGSYNFFGACALGTLLMAICLLLFAATNSIQEKQL